MGAGRELKEVKNPRVLAVEGKDESFFFSALLKVLDIDNVDIYEVGGSIKLIKKLPELFKVSGFLPKVTSLGIVQDSDTSPKKTFKRVKNVLRENGLPVPNKLEKVSSGYFEPAERDINVTVYLMPHNGETGMLEDLCLESVEMDPAMDCVEKYQQCLKEKIDKLPKNISKARVRSFLASRKILENVHFEFIKDCLSKEYKNFENAIDTASVAKIDLILASRYKPTLRLGEAAEAGYWDFKHQAFNDIKSFLEKF